MSKQETPLQRLIAQLNNLLEINGSSALYKLCIITAISQAESLLPEPIEEQSELDQLRTENEKLREWIISIVNRSPMTTTQIQVILSPYDIHQAKQLLNK